jgi:hypothetical protein
MKLNRFAVLPAALALSLAFAPAAFAGPSKGGGDAGGGHNGGGHNGGGQGGGGHSKNGGGGHSKNGGGHGGGGGGGGHSSNFGSGNGHIRSYKCVLNGYTVYVPVRGECIRLKSALAGGSYRSEGHDYISGGVSVQGGSSYAYGGGYATGGGYGYYEQQRVIRYVAQPSRAARMQAEKRARKAAAGYGYASGSGAMIGYGNGVMVGGYGNNVVVNGNVYGNGGYAYGSQRVVVSKKRKGKKHRRVVVQQPAYVMPQYEYHYTGPVMMKGGGY